LHVALGDDVCDSPDISTEKTTGLGRARSHIGMELATCPPFQAEIVPAPVRGFAVGTYQTSLLFGGIIINSVCRGTSGLTSNAAWKIPIGLFYIVPVTIASCIWLIPESPRWLLLQDRTEDALDSLRKLRGADSSYDAEQDLELLRQSLIQEQNQGRYIDLCCGTNLRRTLIAMGMNFFIQATGSPFTAAYGTLFVQSVGGINPFDYSIISSCINFFSCFMSISITDRVGRRPLFMIGSFLQVVWLFTMGGIGLIHNPSIAQKQVIVAATALSSASLCFSWDPLNYLLPLRCLQPDYVTRRNASLPASMYLQSESLSQAKQQGSPPC
jgi:SP family sugar:H+ symporter-like MFS transporter